MKNLSNHSLEHLPSASAPVPLKSKISKALSRKPRAIIVVLLLVSLLVQSQFINAQAPQQFSFQGVARDASGKIVTNQEIGYSFNLHQDSPGGPTVYTREGSTTTSGNGIFNLTVGTAASPLPASLEWATKSFFLQVGVDPDGATNGYTFTDIGTTQLLSVPYSLYSNEAGKWRNNEPILQTGNVGQGTALPTVGFGPRLIWLPQKGAFRAGYANNGAWEEGVLGAFSFAGGYGSKASGAASFSFGNNSQALADNTIAMGYNSTANSTHSIAVGEGSSSTGTHAISIGQSTVANGNNALAMGMGSTANAINAISIGTSTTAIQIGSVAVGTNAHASGTSAISIGQYTSANASYSTALGRFNNNFDVPNGTSTDRLFQIGNGTGLNQRSNALTILRNGNVGIGANATSPQYIMDIDGRIRLRRNGNSAGLWLDNSNNSPFAFIGAESDHTAGFNVDGNWMLTVGDHVTVNGILSCTEVWESSDRVLKRNIVNIRGSLDKLRQLSGYNYHWVSQKSNDKLQTGLIAQEIEKHFPELVITKEDGFKAVRYTGLIPHLIEAVKELDKKTEEISALKKELASVQEVNKKLSALEASVKELLAGQKATSTQTSK